MNKGASRSTRKGRTYARGKGIAEMSGQLFPIRGHAHGQGMQTSTKLIMLLALAVGIVMTLAGYFVLRQREAILVTAMHNEVRAHALTLQITLEDAYRAGRITDAQRLIDRLSENPKIYSVILFDETGRAAMLS